MLTKTAICINEDETFGYLTKGQEYIVRGYTDTEVCVNDKSGQIVWYPVDKFQLLENHD